MVCDVVRLWRTQRILQRAETRLRMCRLRLRSSGYAHANWLRKPAWVYYQAFSTPTVSGEARKFSLHAQIRHGVPEIYDATMRDRFDLYINGISTLFRCAARDCSSVRGPKQTTRFATRHLPSTVAECWTLARLHRGKTLQYTGVATQLPG
jgi:hypothetical protein